MKCIDLLAFSLCLLFAVASQAATGEYIILVGGPSLSQWERYQRYPHDHWWANFVHSARIRTQQIRATAGPKAMITWLVYGAGYKTRAQQDHQDLIGNINAVRARFRVNLIYFRKGNEVINYLNHGQPRDQLKIVDFEYIGHSDERCFMFDYSNMIDSASKSWLHQDDFTRINRGIFAPGAFIKSWGCHTGENMSKKWRAATGTPMIGAIGRTDFSTGELPLLSSPGGKWVK